MKEFNKKYGKWIRAVAFVLVFCLINDFLSTNLVQSGLTRIIMHDMNKKEEGYKCVVFGESHASYGIDPAVLTKETGMNSVNASIGGEYMMDMYYMAEEMYSHQTPKVVVLDIDYQYFENVPADENTVMSTIVYYNYPMSHRKLMYSYDKLMKKEYRTALFPWLNHRDDYDIINGIFWNKRTKAYKEYDPAAVTQIEHGDSYKGKGFIFRDRSYVRDESKKCAVGWNEAKVDSGKSLQYFKKTVDLCRKHGSKVVMVTTPVNTETLLSDVSLPQYAKISRFFNDLAADNNLTYYDFNLVKPSKFIRQTGDYWDYDGHMYGDAAEKYSKFLGNFIEKIENGENPEVSEYIYKDIYEMKENYDKDATEVRSEINSI